jgi:ribosomal protein S18 acetylase RimI-like enzyme
VPRVAHPSLTPFALKIKGCRAAAPREPGHGQKGRDTPAIPALRATDALSLDAVSDDIFTVRPMTARDLPAASQLAGALVAMHHALDAKRFLHLPDAAAGYAMYFAGELASDEVVLVVAERSCPGEGEPIVGYAYGRLEPRSYNDLLDACGKLHDVYVDERARGNGLGKALVRAVVDGLTAKGAPRVLLLTAVQNEAAQHMFGKLGFRTTMLEMTRES